MSRSSLLDSKPKIVSERNGSEIFFRHEDNNLIILVQHDLYVLNKYAAEVWRMFKGRLSLREIIDKICSKYQLNHKRVEREILRLIGYLKDRKLIVFVE